MITDILNGGYKAPDAKVGIPVSKWDESKKQFVPHDNVSISKVYRDEKGHLTIDFNLVEDSKVVASSSVKMIKEYTFDLMDKDNNIKPNVDILNMYLNFQAKLQHIAASYFPEDKLSFKMFDKTTIKTNDDMDKLKDNADIIYDNIVNWFVKIMEKANPNLLLTFKFHRQSEAKTYISIPDYRSFPPSLSEPIYNLFCLPTESPKSKSIKYSNYERGFDKNKQQTRIDRSNPNEIIKDAKANNASGGLLPF